MVDICDSVYPLPPYIQIEGVSFCHLLATQKKTTLQMVNMQHQNGGANSGTFGISAAVSLCHDEYPTAHLKNQLMRKLLVSYLENPYSTMKPIHSRQRIESKYTVPVYCKCHLPWSKDCKLGNMAQCKEYKQRYNQQCANISSLAFLMPAPSGFVKVVYYS